MIKVSTYQILEQDLLSSGRTGTLYRATKIPPPEIKFSSMFASVPIQDDYFVIKRVDPKYILSCLTEKRFIQHLSNHYDKFHEIVDSFSTERHTYIVYRNYQQTLEDFIRNMKTEQQQSLISLIDYMRQIIEAFKVLKTMGIIHRDIRPSNILMINQEKLKITGFYSAMQENETDKSTFCLVSPLYMSPEFIKKEKLTAKSDIWSLGIIFFEMLFRRYPFGNLPFETNDRNEILKNMEFHVNIMEHTPNMFFPTYDPLNVSDQLKEVLIKMLKLNPRERISIDELFQNPLFNTMKLRGIQKCFTETDYKGLSSEETSPKFTKNELFINQQQLTMKSGTSPQFKKEISYPSNLAAENNPSNQNLQNPPNQDTVINCGSDFQYLKPKLYRASIEFFENQQQHPIPSKQLLESAAYPITNYKDLEEMITALQLKYIPFKEIEKKGFIKAGGNGHVFIASYNKQEYALKEISGVSLEFIHKVLREAAYLRKNENPRLIKIYGVSYKVAEFPEKSVDLYILTELSSGDLQDFMERNELSFGHKLRIAYQIAQGVYHLHNSATPLVHSDLKPSNILLDESLKVFITDLGISKEIREWDITCSGSFTPGYAAPEQVLNEVSGRKITPKTDIWSLGLLYYYMFFKIKITWGFIFEKNLFKPGATLQIEEVTEELQGIKELIMKMVRFEAKDRIDCGEVLGVLERISIEMKVEFKSMIGFKDYEIKN